MLNSNVCHPKEIALLRRLFMPLLLLVSGLYLLLTITPFFLLGLHLQPAHLVVGGYFDPKGLPGLNPLTYMMGYASIGDRSDHCCNFCAAHACLRLAAMGYYASS